MRAADAGAVREPRAGRGALPAGVRRGGLRRDAARQLLPAVPAAGPDAGPLRALGPGRPHRPPRRRERPRPAGPPRRRRRVGHRAARPRRLHRQRRRPSPGIYIYIYITMHATISFCIFCTLALEYLCTIAI